MQNSNSRLRPLSFNPNSYVYPLLAIGCCFVALPLVFGTSFSGFATAMQNPESANDSRPKTVQLQTVSNRTSPRPSSKKHAAVQDDRTDEEKKLGIFPRTIPLPDFPKDGKWLNTGGPIRKADLKGKFVLIDFWTYCCINCIHILPELKKLEEKYPNELVVIGCHSAKFKAEQDSKNITQAVMRYEIKHPVLNDNEMRYWNRIGARSWPTIILVNPDGGVFWGRGGEVTFEQLDEILGSQIKKFKDSGKLDTTPLKFKLAEENLKPTPLRFPGKILADEKSNRLFISDSNHNRIVITDLDGKLIDTIGSGRIGRRDGSFKSAEFDHPQGMALNGQTLYVADTENHLIRKIDLVTKTVKTIAGTGKQARESFFVPEGAAGPRKWTTTKLLAMPLNSPWALHIHENRLIIAMAGNHQVWEMPLNESYIGLWAGNGREDIVDGPFLPTEPYAAGASSFAQPSGLTADGEFLYLADSEGSSIRKIPLSGKGNVQTLVGTSGEPRNRLFIFGDQDGDKERVLVQHPLGVAYHDGFVYVADTYNNKIKAIDTKTGRTKTFAGNGQPGNENDPATFDEPSGVAIANGKVYVTDTNNHLIRTVDLKTQKASTLKIDGLRPVKKINRQFPIFNNAVEIPISRALVTKPGPLKISIMPDLPEGWKINKDGPSIFLTVVDEKDSQKPIMVSDAVQFGDDAYVIPATIGANAQRLKINLRYFYCQQGGEGLCKIGEASWTLEVNPKPDSKNESLELRLPVKVD
jgi:DNA-binding beta-propeller fold protein YncE